MKTMCNVIVGFSHFYCRHGVSTNVLVLKSALSTFFAVLEGTLDRFSDKVLVLMLEYLLLTVLVKHN